MPSCLPSVLIGCPLISRRFFFSIHCVWCIHLDSFMNNIQKIFLIVFAISLVVFLIAANSNYEQWNMIFHYIVKNSIEIATELVFHYVNFIKWYYVLSLCQVFFKFVHLIILLIGVIIISLCLPFGEIINYLLGLLSFQILQM